MTQTAYEKLSARFEEISTLGGAMRMLEWDRATVMPPGGGAARGQQMALLTRLHHEALVAPQVGDWLDEAEANPPSATWDLANLRKMRWTWRHAACVPVTLANELSLASHRTELRWRDARRDSDFAAIAPELDTLLALVREKAQAKAGAFAQPPYDCLMDAFDPGRQRADVQAIFNDVATYLPPMIDTALGTQTTPPPFPNASRSQQIKLCRSLLRTFGFDFDHGRLDESAHPFSTGVPDDTRITTRYDEDDVVTGMMGTIHEAGHARFERGLPPAWRSQPVGTAPGLTAHESQSLFFELQIARSPMFIQYLATVCTGALGEQVSPASLQARLHFVARSHIRVDADELTYPLHILLRTRLEEALIDGSLAVKDIPEAWNAVATELLGAPPPDDGHGCLQDIHWYGGDFGYFPTYLLGAIAAAQLFRAATQAIPSLPHDLANGQLTGLLSWLSTHVHAHGSRASVDTLVHEATGAPLSTEAHRAHLTRRFIDRDET